MSLRPEVGNGSPRVGTKGGRSTDIRHRKKKVGRRRVNETGNRPQLSGSKSPVHIDKKREEGLFNEGHPSRARPSDT